MRWCAHLRCFFSLSALGVRQYELSTKGSGNKKSCSYKSIREKKGNTCLETYPKPTPLDSNVSWHLRELFEVLLRCQQSSFASSFCDCVIEPTSSAFRLEMASVVREEEADLLIYGIWFYRFRDLLPFSQRFGISNSPFTHFHTCNAGLKTCAKMSTLLWCIRSINQRRS